MCTVLSNAEKYKIGQEESITSDNERKVCVLIFLTEI